MNDPWKLTTIGLIVAIVTAVTSGLTTAYLLSATAPAPSVDVVRAPARPVPTEDVEAPRRAPIVRVTRSVPQAAAVRRARVETVATPAVAAATVPQPDPAPAPVAPAPRAEATSAAETSPTAGIPSDCATGGARAWRIAKPGAVGTLLGAGVGAAGGAIADGGRGAGKGALWGGLAGAALGSAWGAYKTKQECGTILGSGDAVTSRTPNVAPRETAPHGGTDPEAAEASFISREESNEPAAGRGITIYTAP